MASKAAHLAWEHFHNTSIAQTTASKSEQTSSEAPTVLWQRVEQLLANAREQRVAYLLFHCGFSPHEIVQRCPREFPDIQEVLSLRHAIMKKLVHIL